MKNQTSRHESPQSARVAILSSIITAVTTISVAFIAIVPQLRQADAKRIEEMQEEIKHLKQSVGAIIPTALEEKTGTMREEARVIQAPQIRFRWAQIDPQTPKEQYVVKGNEALDRSGFTGIGRNEGTSYGFDRAYTGLVLNPQPGFVLFVVSGPDWQAADSKVENLRRGF